jgi:hypothetical protein
MVAFIAWLYGTGEDMSDLDAALNRGTPFPSGEGSPATAILISAADQFRKVALPGHQ